MMKSAVACTLCYLTHRFLPGVQVHGCLVRSGNMTPSIRLADTLYQASAGLSFISLTCTLMIWRHENSCKLYVGYIYDWDGIDQDRSVVPTPCLHGWLYMYVQPFRAEIMCTVCLNFSNIVSSFICLNFLVISKGKYLDGPHFQTLYYITYVCFTCNELNN